MLYRKGRKNTISNTMCSVSEYIKMIKLHAIGVSENLDGIDIKVKFIYELSPVNEKRVHEFGVKKLLSEHLLKPLTNLAEELVEPQCMYSCMIKICGLHSHINFCI